VRASSPCRNIKIVSRAEWERVKGAYDGSAHAPSFLEIAGPEDPVLVLNSFSKPWAQNWF